MYLATDIAKEERRHQDEEHTWTDNRGTKTHRHRIESFSGQDIRPFSLIDVIPG